MSDLTEITKDLQEIHDLRVRKVFAGDAAQPAVIAEGEKQLANDVVDALLEDPKQVKAVRRVLRRG